MKIIILGGTTEASELVNLLAGYPNIKFILSLAGRTKNPVLPQANYRIGGFGGVAGLVDYIRKNNITAIVCATHPFARQMPFNAQGAAKIVGIPILYLVRPEWKAEAGDKWIEVENHKSVIPHLMRDDKLNIFLTVGRLELDEYKKSPQHFYVIRSIDEISEKLLKNATYITDRPPFTVAGELALMREHKINLVITKNSGGEATRAKLTAARELGLPIILLKRPPRPEGLHMETANAALEWITANYKTGA